MAKKRSRRLISSGPADDPGELVPLNLIYDYPVRWSRYKVLRDFVQNFYDAVQWHEWHSRFQYRQESGLLEMTALDTGFSYEWLLHIGASTKREDAGKYAGYFGEGFKIASLCAIRDYAWNVRLRSRNWELVVTHSSVNVDGYVRGDQERRGGVDGHGHLRSHS